MTYNVFGGTLSLTQSITLNIAQLDWLNSILYREFDIRTSNVFNRFKIRRMLL